MISWNPDRDYYAGRLMDRNPYFYRRQRIRSQKAMVKKNRDTYACAIIVS